MQKFVLLTLLNYIRKQAWFVIKTKHKHYFVPLVLYVDNIPNTQNKNKTQHIFYYIRLSGCFLLFKVKSHIFSTATPGNCKVSLQLLQFLPVTQPNPSNYPVYPTQNFSSQSHPTKKTYCLLQQLWNHLIKTHITDKSAATPLKLPNCLHAKS